MGFAALPTTTPVEGNEGGLREGKGSKRHRGDGGDDVAARKIPDVSNT